MKKQYLLILMLLISFGSIGAVAFTPGMPQIASFFKISAAQTELTVSWYLLGYALGQLVYGPLINRLGSNKTIMFGTLIEIAGSFGCILASPTNSFLLLIIARFLMALGAGCGLTMTFTICSNLCKSKEENAKAISLLTIAFAITPGLGIFVGGILVTYFGWVSTFYFTLGYGLMILILNQFLPEVITTRGKDALKLSRIIGNYKLQLTKPIIFGGLLVGSGTCIIYTFAALAPFIAMKIMGISPKLYGLYNFIPVVGLLVGPMIVAKLSKFYTPYQSVKLGLGISLIGILLLSLSLYLLPNNAYSLFVPVLIVYFGFTFIFGNGSALALEHCLDKGNGSAIMSFINMISAVIMVYLTGRISFHGIMLLPILFWVYLVIGYFSSKEFKPGTIADKIA